MQAVALDKYINENISCVYTVDYQCKHFVNYYSDKLDIKGENPIKSLIKYLVLYPSKRIKKHKFSKFISENLKLLGNNVDYEYLSNLKNDENIVFLVGSDQVFSIDCAGFDPAYFLMFAKSNQKYSYAASFGFTSVPKDYIEEYEDRLKDFKFLSLREDNAFEIVRNQLSLEVPSEVHIDPTFLLKKDQWNKLSKAPKTNNYILTYFLWDSEEMRNKAYEVSEKTGLPIYNINVGGLCLKYKMKHIRSAGPSEFLGWISNAKYVITNSFHGTAFSIIMHKNFITQCNLPYNKGCRIENLLKICELDHCGIENGGFFDTAIDWDRVEERLDIEREKSKKYLEMVADSLDE